MSVFPEHFTFLYDHDRKVIGILMSPELWAKTEKAISPIIDVALEELDPARVVELPEPMEALETLLKYWDFQYPMPYDVLCSNCSSTTENWKEDEPRKFRLRSATLSGLLNFECQQCKARILKKHFKKHVDVECRPYVA